MEPRIETLVEKKLIGKRIRMSLADNKRFQLWNSFMQQRKEIENTVSNNLYSVEVYDSTDYFKNFSPHTEYDKWAAVEVSDVDAIPSGMETITIPCGLYAVFIHKGPASKGPETYQYIFGTWLPTSSHTLDHRPHFAVMGAKYKNEDSDSEEEIWVRVMNI